MRKYLLSAAVFTLLAAPSAWSDPPAGHGNRGHENRAESNHQGPPQGERNVDRGTRSPGPQASNQAPPNAGNQERNFDRGNRASAPQAAMQAPPNRDNQERQFDRGNRGPQLSFQSPPDRGDRDRDRNDNNRRAFNDNRPDNRGDRRGFNDNRANPPTLNRQASRDFNRDGRTDFRQGHGAGPRRDFSGFRDYHRNFRVSRRFYAPTYRRPAGWYQHRWTFGEFLPTAYWVRDYWLVDFAVYDLPPPPFGAVWVRVGYDALLIDDETGEIITVAYDVFY